jgi:hypothetical protein
VPPRRGPCVVQKKEPARPIRKRAAAAEPKGFLPRLRRVNRLTTDWLPFPPQVFLNYRLNPATRSTWPEWYVPYAPEEAERRWS